MLEAAKIRTGRNIGGGKLAVIAFATAVGSTAAGFLIGNRWVLPALNALAIYPFYLELILGGRRRKAIALALLWAVFLSQAMIAGTYLFPARAERVTIRGAEYRAEMFDWVKTGEGKESSPRLFAPEHVRDLAVFAALAFFTGGLGALFLGAVLMNYMNFYVGALTAASAHRVLTLLLAWQPYAVIRVVGYVIVATVLAEAAFGLLRRRPLSRRSLGAWGAFGLALVAADVLLKIVLAPAWSRILSWTVGADFGT